MSQLNLTEIGAFTCGDDLHARDVTISGQTFTVHVRRLPALDLRRFHEEAQAQDMEVRLHAGFRVVAKAIRQEDGKPLMTVDQAKTLKTEPMREFMRVFVDVNRLPDEDALGNA